MNFVAEAICKILDSPSFELRGEPTNEAEFNEMFFAISWDENGNQIESNDPSTFGVTWSQISEKLVEVKADYDSKQYQRDRKLEYPTIEELVVALYDESDKASIIERRNAVKAKYPKPE
mgnify:CR=1 FL=1|tara:strand:- start:83 stop:439 length:357 start_codon:yes stop_codon:yes gene_type:complete